MVPIALHQQERLLEQMSHSHKRHKKQGPNYPLPCRVSLQAFFCPRLPNSSLALPPTSALPCFPRGAWGTRHSFGWTTQHRHLQLVPDGNNKLTKQRKIPAQRRKRRKALRDFPHRITSTRLRPPDMNHHSRKTGLPRIRIVSPSHQGGNEADKVWDHHRGVGYQVH